MDIKFKRFWAVLIIIGILFSFTALSVYSSGMEYTPIPIDQNVANSRIFVPVRHIYGSYYYVNTSEIEISSKLDYFDAGYPDPNYFIFTKPDLDSVLDGNKQIYRGDMPFTIDADKKCLMLWNHSAEDVYTPSVTVPVNASFSSVGFVAESRGFIFIKVTVNYEDGTSKAEDVEIKNWSTSGNALFGLRHYWENGTQYAGAETRYFHAYEVTTDRSKVIKNIEFSYKDENAGATKVAIISITGTNMSDDAIYVKIGKMIGELPEEEQVGENLESTYKTLNDINAFLEELGIKDCEGFLSDAAENGKISSETKDKYDAVTARFKSALYEKFDEYVGMLPDSSAIVALGSEEYSKAVSIVENINGMFEKYGITKDDFITEGIEKGYISEQTNTTLESVMKRLKVLEIESEIKTLPMPEEVESGDETEILAKLKTICDKLEQYDVSDELSSDMYGKIKALNLSLITSLYDVIDIAEFSNSRIFTPDDVSLYSEANYDFKNDFLEYGYSSNTNIVSINYNSYSALKSTDGFIHGQSGAVYRVLNNGERAVKLKNNSIDIKTIGQYSKLHFMATTWRPSIVTEGLKIELYYEDGYRQIYDAANNEEIQIIGLSNTADVDESRLIGTVSYREKWYNGGFTGNFNGFKLYEYEVAVDPQRSLSDIIFRAEPSIAVFILGATLETTSEQLMKYYDNGIANGIPDDAVQIVKLNKVANLLSENGIYEFFLEKSEVLKEKYNKVFRVCDISFDEKWDRFEITARFSHQVSKESLNTDTVDLTYKNETVDKSQYRVVRGEDNNVIIEVLNPFIMTPEILNIRIKNAVKTDEDVLNPNLLDDTVMNVTPNLYGFNPATTVSYIDSENNSATGTVYSEYTKIITKGDSIDIIVSVKNPAASSQGYTAFCGIYTEDGKIMAQTVTKGTVPSQAGRDIKFDLTVPDDFNEGEVRCYILDSFGSMVLKCRPIRFTLIKE